MRKIFVTFKVLVSWKKFDINKKRAGSFAINYNWRTLPDGICAKYAAQEFEKIAPSPGVNWLAYNYDWIGQAQQAGWVVKTEVHYAMIGAIVEWQNLDRGNGHLAVVRTVLADKIIVEENNVGKIIGSINYTFAGKKLQTEVTKGWGKTTIRAIKYDDMAKMGTRKFIGYIWPVRQDEYNQLPSKYAVSLSKQINIKEPLYKGFREYWSGTYILKEFDKIAPKPGVNWHGNVHDWVENADQTGWVKKCNSDDAKIGALIIRTNPAKNLVKVGIVREIKNNLITIDTRKTNLYPITETINLSDLKSADKNSYVFLGYIWPIRK